MRHFLVLSLTVFTLLLNSSAFAQGSKSNPIKTSGVTEKDLTIQSIEVIKACGTGGAFATGGTVFRLAPLTNIVAAPVGGDWDNEIDRVGHHSLGASLSVVCVTLFGGLLGTVVDTGVASVQFCADQICMSADYAKNELKYAKAYQSEKFSGTIMTWSAIGRVWDKYLVGSNSQCSTQIRNFKALYALFQTQQQACAKAKKKS